MVDKGYHINLPAWWSGQELVYQLIFAKSNRKFTGWETIKLTKIATYQSRNECTVWIHQVQITAKQKHIHIGWCMVGLVIPNQLHVQGCIINRFTNSKIRQNWINLIFCVWHLIWFIFVFVLGRHWYYGQYDKTSKNDNQEAKWFRVTFSTKGMSYWWMGNMQQMWGQQVRGKAANSTASKYC